MASLWRLAGIDSSGVRWAEVAGGLEDMQARGTLFPPDVPFLDKARALAAAAEG